MTANEEKPARRMVILKPRGRLIILSPEEKRAVEGVERDPLSMDTLDAVIRFSAVGALRDCHFHGFHPGEDAIEKWERSVTNDTLFGGVGLERGDSIPVIRGKSVARLALVCENAQRRERLLRISEEYAKESDGYSAKSAGAALSQLLGNFGRREGSRGDSLLLALLSQVDAFSEDERRTLMRGALNASR